MFKTTWNWLLDNFFLHRINLSPQVKLYVLQPALRSEKWRHAGSLIEYMLRHRFGLFANGSNYSRIIPVGAYRLRQSSNTGGSVVRCSTETIRYTLYRRFGFLSNGCNQWKYSNQFLKQPLSNGFRKIPDGPLRYEYRFLFILSLVVRLIEIWLSYLGQMKKYKGIKIQGWASNKKVQS